MCESARSMGCRTLGAWCIQCFLGLFLTDIGYLPTADYFWHVSKLTMFNCFRMVPRPIYPWWVHTARCKLRDWMHSPNIGECQTNGIENQQTDAQDGVGLQWQHGKRKQTSLWHVFLLDASCQPQTCQLYRVPEFTQGTVMIKWISGGESSHAVYPAATPCKAPPPSWTPFDKS